MKHKHAEIIKAWADGIEIEKKSVHGAWEPQIEPQFFDWCEYRIKPKQKVVRWLWAYERNGEWFGHHQYLTDSEAKQWFGEKWQCDHKKLEYTRQEFDE